MMKMKKGIAGVLCAALVCGGAGQAMHALAAGGEKTPGTAGENMQAVNMSGEDRKNANTGGEKTSAGTGQEGIISKDETVYILTDAGGTVQEIIVSDWIRNAPGADEVRDRTELTGVENIKSGEGYTLEGDRTFVWDAQGNDIYYQGNADKEPPVSLSVTYMLDGRKVTPQELAGKSGRVTIRYEYTNNQYEDVEIGGAGTRIYVPFAMLTGMILDNDVFTNVEVVNGRVVNDGDRTVVVGLAFPGQQENLGIGKDKLDIPDFMELTADVKNFELGMTATIATNALFNEMEGEEGDSLGDLNGLLEELTDAMNQLTDGSSELYEGICTLLEKSDELIAGIDKLSAGASELRNGVGALEEGAGQLQSGAASLQAGLNTLSANNGQLNSGARQVFDTLLATAQTQLAGAGLNVPAMTVENYGDVLNGIIASLDPDAVYQQALSQVTAAVEQQRSTIESKVTEKVRAEIVLPQVTAAVRAQVEGSVRAAVQAQVEIQVIQAMTGRSKEDYEAGIADGSVDEATQTAVKEGIEAGMAAQKDAIAQETDKQMADAGVQATVEQTVNAKMQEDEVRQQIGAAVEAQIQQLIAQNMQTDAVQNQIAAASEGAKSVIALKTSLDSYNAFYLGLLAYTAGVSEAAAGAGQLKGGVDELKAGTEKLYSGATQLCDGIQTMKNSAPALTDGIKQLRDGAKQLSDGLDQFNEEAVQKLVDAVDGDLDSLAERIHAILDVSKDYQSFAGMGEDMEGQVKFIYRTDGIEAGE